MTRPCPRCGAIVEVTPTRKKHSRYLCNSCSNKVVKAWAKEHPEEYRLQALERVKRYQKAHPERLPSQAQKAAYDRNYTLLIKYGITAQQYCELLEAQGFSCAICGSIEPRSRSGRFHVDHCHETGRIRGLLCSPCNFGLGVFKDRPELLRAAADYLSEER